MTRYFDRRQELVEYVFDLLPNLRPGSVLTMTIRPVRSGDYSVTFATDVLSGDTDPLTSLSKRRPISDKGPDYTFPPGGKSADAGLGDPLDRTDSVYRRDHRDR